MKRYIKQKGTRCGAYTFAYWYYRQLCEKLPITINNTKQERLIGDRRQVELLYDLLKCSGANKYKNYTNPISILLFLVSAGKKPVFYLGPDEIAYEKKDLNTVKHLTLASPIKDLFKQLENNSKDYYKSLLKFLKENGYISNDKNMPLPINTLAVGDYIIAFCFEDGDKPAAKNMHYILIYRSGKDESSAKDYAINPWHGKPTVISSFSMDTTGNYKIKTDTDKKNKQKTVYCFGAGIHIPAK